MSDASGRGPTRLPRPPGDRYRGPAPARRATGIPARTVLMAVGVADAGALVLFVLGQAGFGPGLLAVSAFTGWLVAVALVEGIGAPGLAPGAARLGLAVGLPVMAVIAGVLLDWLLSTVTGGVLGPLAYAGERYGLALLLNIGVAGGLGALHAR